MYRSFKRSTLVGLWLYLTHTGKTVWTKTKSTGNINMTIIGHKNTRYKMDSSKHSGNIRIVSTNELSIFSNVLSNYFKGLSLIIISFKLS